MRFGAFGFSGFGFGTATNNNRLVSGGAPPPTDFWPQPDFDSSTGITLGAFFGSPPTITGGQLVFSAASGGYAYADATAEIVAGTYRVTADIASFVAEEDSFQVTLAADAPGSFISAATFNVTDGAGLKSQDAVVGGGDILGQLIGVEDANGVVPVLNSLSVTKVS